MKTLFNITTSDDDLQRFQNTEQFLSMLDGFDGVELMYFDKDTKQIIPKEKVCGLHMHFFPFWVDFWNGNEKALLKEFDSKENWEACYGGSEREAMIRRFKKDLEHAHRYGAEYVVFHISEASIEESFTWQYSHSDEEVIDAVAELLNELFKEEDGTIALLMENLWQPGLTFTRPETTKRLMEKVQYPNKGIMLDTGHLLHMNTKLRTQEEGVTYIQQMLDLHGDLCKYIRGMHLNQSLTGPYCEETKKNPPKMGATYAERYNQMFFHAYSVDKHEPFTCAGVKELVERIAPEYLTFEFITMDNHQHREYLKKQLQVFNE